MEDRRPRFSYLWPLNLVPLESMGTRLRVLKQHRPQGTSTSYENQSLGSYQTDVSDGGLGDKLDNFRFSEGSMAD